MSINRRDFTRGAIAATAALATITPSGAVFVPSAPIAPLLPAWVVGTSGDWNWRVIRASTEADAVSAWCNAEYGRCSPVEGVLAERHEEWDDVHVETGDERWFKSGMGVNCDQCGYEAFIDHGGALDGSEFICEDCALARRYIDEDEGA